MRVPAAELRHVTEASLVAAGYPADEIPQMLEVLTYAQWRGNWQSLVQLAVAGWPPYRATRPIHIERETPVSALLDGELHPGIAVMWRAAEVAKAKAKDSGVAVVGAHHSAPPGTGALGYYVEQLGTAGLVAFAWSGSSELVAPYGGAEPRFGTNPIAVAFPSADEPVVIDLATSAIPAFELARARLFGAALPPAAALDDRGHGTDDPELATALTTFGDSPKSSALALMVEILTGPLVTASFTGTGDTRNNWGNLIVAVDPAILASRSSLEAGVDVLLQNVRATRPRPGFAAVTIPGESARARARQVETSGHVEIDDELWQRVLGRVRAS
jgi:LDH2 family malate/lactate/ureidoglycolate dehydrogenase